MYTCCVYFILVSSVLICEREFRLLSLLFGLEPRELRSYYIAIVGLQMLTDPLADSSSASHFYAL